MPSYRIALLRYLGFNLDIWNMKLAIQSQEEIKNSYQGSNAGLLHARQ